MSTVAGKTTDALANFSCLAETLTSEGTQDDNMYIDFEELEIAVTKFEKLLKAPKVTIKIFDDFLLDEFTNEEGECNIEAHAKNLDLWIQNVNSLNNSRSPIQKFFENLQVMKSTIKGNFRDMMILGGLSRPPKVVDTIATTEVTKVEEVPDGIDLAA